MYEMINWENTPSKTTPISAENLSKMDRGIKEAHERLVNLENSIDAKVQEAVRKLEYEILGGAS